ncbi:hypothetical protein ACIA8I_32190 [Streptomyces rishiriensis]|uniref:hypothetical protein n=1 Tax=Streptomyces rishiriensis TaxID=68264 RepID=UPI0037AA554B
MTNPNLTTGSIWRLHHGDQEIARLAVTGTDMPWTHAEVEALPGFEEFRPSSVSKSGLSTRTTGSGLMPAISRSAVHSP